LILESRVFEKGFFCFETCYKSLHNIYFLSNQKDITKYKMSDNITRALNFENPKGVIDIKDLSTHLTNGDVTMSVIKSKDSAIPGCKWGWSINGGPVLVAINSSKFPLTSRYGMTTPKMNPNLDKPGSNGNAIVARDVYSVGIQLFNDEGQNEFHHTIIDAIKELRAFVLKKVLGKRALYVPKLMTADKGIVEHCVHEPFIHAKEKVSDGNGGFTNVEAPHLNRPTLYVKTKNYDRNKIEALAKIDALINGAGSKNVDDEIEKALYNSFTTQFYDISQAVSKTSDGKKRKKVDIKRVSPVDRSYESVLGFPMDIPYMILHFEGLWFNGTTTFWQIKLVQCMFNPREDFSASVNITWNDESDDETEKENTFREISFD
jgi:hypothetical protein